MKQVFHQQTLKFLEVWKQSVGVAWKLYLCLKNTIYCGFSENNTVD
jgi:hypothetical protein